MYRTAALILVMLLVAGAAASGPARGLSPGATAQLVAVIDTGADHESPTLAGRLAGASVNLAGRGGNDDLAGHETAVAGIIARGDAASENLVLRADMPGTCPGRCVCGEGEPIRARAHASAHEAAVVTMSPGSERRLSRPSRRVMRRAAAAGSTLLVTAGNGGGRPPARPARWPARKKLRAVSTVAGASTGSGELAPFTAGARKTRCNHLLASGVGVALARCGGRAGPASGISFAAPLASRALASLLGAQPRRTPREAVALLLATARNAGRRGAGKVRGRGLPDRDAALAAARAGGSPVVTRRSSRLRLGPAFGGAAADPGPRMRCSADRSRLERLRPEKRLPQAAAGAGGSRLLARTDGAGARLVVPAGPTTDPGVATTADLGTAVARGDPGRPAMALAADPGGFTRKHKEAWPGLVHRRAPGLGIRCAALGEGGGYTGWFIDLVAEGAAGRLRAGAGMVDEHHAIPGSVGSPTPDAGARSVFLRVGVTMPLGEASRALARGAVARSERRRVVARTRGVMSGIATRSFGVGLERGGLLRPGERFRMGMAQPKRAGDDKITPGGGGRAVAGPRGREIALELAPMAPLGPGAGLGRNALVRSEPGHPARAAPDRGGLVRLDLCSRDTLGRNCSRYASLQHRPANRRSGRDPSGAPGGHAR